MKKALLFLTFTICIGLQNYSQSPADLKATAETAQFYKKLLSLIEKGIMIGHQDDYVYGHAWKTNGVSDIKQVAGDYPAVFGWELADLELKHTKSIDSVSLQEIRNGIKWVNSNGGINTISWHCNNALTGKNAWDVSSKLVVKSILPGGEKNVEFIKMLDLVADFFLSLKDDNGQLIPVIFRPYHENTGSWFWWGQKLCSAQEYISLWQYTVEHLKNRGVHNLLYCYSSASGLKDESEYLERFPGFEIVDLIGFDEYQGGTKGKDNYIKSIKNMMGIIVPLAKEHKKIPILAETGLESLPDPKWWTETLWPAIKDYPISYVLMWRNACDKPTHYYAPFPGEPSTEDFKKLKDIPKTLFLGDIR